MGDVAPKLNPVGRQNRWLVLGTCHFQECGKIVPELIQTVPDSVVFLLKKQKFMVDQVESFFQVNKHSSCNHLGRHLYVPKYN